MNKLSSAHLAVLECKYCNTLNYIDTSFYGYAYCHHCGGDSESIVKGYMVARFDSFPIKGDEKEWKRR